MGGSCSKQKLERNPYAGQVKGQEKLCNQSQRHVKRDVNTKVLITHPVPVVQQDSIDDHVMMKDRPKLSNVSDDEFYDGIPRYRSSLSFKSRTLKVAEVGYILGKAGSVGLEHAVEVLDTLGSSVTNLNLVGSGFVSGLTNKNNELSILAFEVANTIVKGSNLIQSLSKQSIRKLKEVILPSEGIQQLISKDIGELLSIVAADKREELKVFSGEVIRFGNRCKDPQWHNLERFFEKHSRDHTSTKHMKALSESVMLQLMTSVRLTAELYQGLHTLGEYEQEHHKRLVELKYDAAQRGDRDNSVNVLAAKIKSQRKLVKSLKKKSLWSISMEEVMEKLVDIVLFLNQEMNTTFVNLADGEKLEKESISCKQKLGPAGLSLHYANIILQIDSIVARSSSMLPSSRDKLYQSLPPNIKAYLRTKLHSFHVPEKLTVMEIKDEMEKTLQWLAPIAANTAKAHHGFGWVGEWANTGSELNRRTVGRSEVMQIETLYNADKQKTEAYIIDLLAWLNSLITRSKASSKRCSVLKPLHISSATCSPGKDGERQLNTEDIRNNESSAVGKGSSENSLDLID